MGSHSAEEQAKALLERWRRVASNWREGAPPETFEHSAAISRSSLALLHEHLRRLGLLSLQWEALQEWTFCDEAVSPVVRAVDENARLPRTWWKQLEGTDLHWVAQFSARNHLHYTLYVAEMRNPPVGVPDPYEPWLRLFERGAYLYAHNDRFHVSNDCWIIPPPLPEYASREPLLDLSDDALDRLDLVQEG